MWIYKKNQFLFIIFVVHLDVVGTGVKVKVKVKR
jgi:hypothetical protein